MRIQTEGTKKSTCKHSISRGKRCFQKKVTPILVDRQQQQQQYEEKEAGFAVVFP